MSAVRGTDEPATKTANQILHLVFSRRHFGVVLAAVDRNALDAIADQLQEEEVISGDEVKRLANECGRQVPAHGIT